MIERLTVTADDVLREPGTPTATPVLIIDLSDIPADPPRRRSGHTITISAADVAAFEPAPASVVSQLEQDMFRMVLEARQRYIPSWVPRKTLSWHPGVASVARGHAADMLARRFVGHTTPEGVTAAQRLDRAGVTFLACGENIGVVYGPASHGQNGIVEIQNAFMNQPRSLTNHRGNILNPLWTHVGIGVAYGPEGQLVVAQKYITTLSGS